MQKVANGQLLSGFAKALVFALMILIGAITMAASWILGTLVVVVCTGMVDLQNPLAIFLATVVVLAAVLWLLNLLCEKQKGEPWGSELRKSAKTIGLRVGIVVGLGLAVGAGFVGVFFDDFRWSFCAGDSVLMMNKGNWDGAAEKLTRLKSISSNFPRQHIASLLRVYCLDRASRFDESEREGRATIKELESAHNLDKIELANAYVILAHSYADADKRNEAEELFAKAVETINASRRENHTKTNLQMFGIYWPEGVLKLPSAYKIELTLLKYYTDDGKLREAQQVFDEVSKDPELPSDKDSVAQLNQQHAELLARQAKPAVSDFDAAEKSNNARTKKSADEASKTNKTRATP